MSHANGAVKFTDGLILHYEYDGTADIIYPKLWRSNAELWEHWREMEPFDRECHCDDNETVEIISSYGGGFWWIGTACRRCKLITSETLMDNIYASQDVYSGQPDWSPYKYNY